MIWEGETAFKRGQTGIVFDAPHLDFQPFSLAGSPYDASTHPRQSGAGGRRLSTLKTTDGANEARALGQPAGRKGTV